MKKRCLLLLLLLLLLVNVITVRSQDLSGTLKLHAGQTMTLTGFDYYKSYELAKTMADSLGYFSFNCPKGYKGMALLQTQDKSSLAVALTEPLIVLEGTHLKEPDSLKFIESPGNTQFATLANNYMHHQQVYKAWRYLQPIIAYFPCQGKNSGT